MLGKRAVDAELKRSLGLSMKEVKPLFAVGGDLAEKKFMECCRCLWSANGAELLEPFVDAAFNDLPEKSRAILQCQASRIMFARSNVLNPVDGCQKVLVVRFIKILMRVRILVEV